MTGEQGYRNSPCFRPSIHPSLKRGSGARCAIKIARQQKAKSWELRAATSLAGLYKNQNKRGEARRLLTEIYEGFTEGFDTLDLREAKALLDELS